MIIYLAGTQCLRDGRCTVATGWNDPWAVGERCSQALGVYISVYIKSMHDDIADACVKRVALCC